MSVVCYSIFDVNESDCYNTLIAKINSANTEKNLCANWI